MTELIVILVGASGWIGQPLMKELRLRGIRVIGVVSSTESLAKLQHDTDCAADSLRVCDVRNADSCAQLFASLPAHTERVVVQSTAPGSRAADGNADELYRSLYYGGAVNCVEQLRPHRFVFVSSTSVLGFNDGRVCDDTSERSADGPRAQAMIDAEDAALNNAFGVGIVARLAGLYGPGRTHLIKSMRGGTARLDADGGARVLNYVYRDDVVSALVTLVTAASARGIYNVVDEGGVTQRDCLQFLSTRLQLPMPEIEVSAGSERTNRRATTNKRVVATRLPQELGWRASQSTLLIGLDHLIQLEEDAAEQSAKSKQ
jgi:nucleoside-diphosphate-sugar epimerase